MSRPKPTIILSKEVTEGILWDNMPADNQYTLLYKQQPCAIRKGTGWTAPGFKYLKSTYSNEGSIRAQVKRLNDIFECSDFSYVKSA